MTTFLSTKGSRAQAYQQTHVSFLELWAEGHDPLEIGLLMGLSAQQLTKHALQAFTDHSPRKEPSYLCETWKSLPASIRRLMPGGEDRLVKIEGNATGVNLTWLDVTAPTQSNQME